MIKFVWTGTVSARHIKYVSSGETVKQGVLNKFQKEINR